MALTVTQPTNRSLGTLEQSLQDFVRALAGKNRSPATIRAYQTDVGQFITWIHQPNMVIQRPEQVERVDLTEYLAHLDSRQFSGVSRLLGHERLERTAIYTQPTIHDLEVAVRRLERDADG